MNEEKISSARAEEKMREAESQVRHWKQLAEKEKVRESQEKEKKARLKTRDCVDTKTELWRIKRGDLAVFHPDKEQKKTFIIGRVHSFVQRSRSQAYVFLSELQCVCVDGKVKKRLKQFEKEDGGEYNIERCWLVSKDDVMKVQDVESAKLGVMM